MPSFVPSAPWCFLVVDDCGFARTFPDNRGRPIDFSAYLNLVRLADALDTQVVLAVTTKFLDVDRITPTPAPHADTPRLIALIERHPHRLRVADHGYDHQFGPNYGEFYDYHRGRRRAPGEQARHLDLSAAVFRRLGWPQPELFVAPAHGWQPGVTDRLVAERGGRFLTSQLWLKHALARPADLKRLACGRLFRPQTVYPDHSCHLEVLPRLGVGITSEAMPPGGLDGLKLHWSVVPTGGVAALLLHRRRVSQPHNYSVHIGNFAGHRALRRWQRWLERIARRKAVFPPTFEASVRCWRTHCAPGRRQVAP